MSAIGQQTYGIDHPLVTVKDHAQALEQFRALGFSPSPISYHPWGTVTSLLMFPGNFIEVIGVDDESKFGTNSVNGFCFGRQLGSFLQRGEEGISLVALHSKDADADHASLTERGLNSQGRIDFRRKMTLPDGSPDEAVVSLALFIDNDAPDISNFICHQHRPELIWVKGWQQHANGVTGIAGLTYIGDLDLYQRRWQSIYQDKVQRFDDKVEVDSGCGWLRAVSRDKAKELFQPMELPTTSNERPHAVAMTLNTTSLTGLKQLLRTNKVPFYDNEHRVLIQPELAGNVILEFIES